MGGERASQRLRKTFHRSIESPRNSLAGRCLLAVFLAVAHELDVVVRARPVRRLADDARAVVVIEGRHRVEEHAFNRTVFELPNHVFFARDEAVRRSSVSRELCSLRAVTDGGGVRRAVEAAVSTAGVEPVGKPTLLSSREPNSDETL